MRVFSDYQNRTWSVAINVAAVKRVRGLVGVDLLALVNEGMEPLSRLLADPVRLADVLYCLCKDEADARQVSDEDFGRALYGDAIGWAAEAFVEELFDFFPDARARVGMRKVLEMSHRLKAKMMDQAEQALDQLDLDSLAQQLMSTPGKPSTNSPESSESTPTRSLSVVS
jgi:hypothetical protein